MKLKKNDTAKVRLHTIRANVERHTSEIDHPHITPSPEHKQDRENRRHGHHQSNEHDP